MSSKVKLFLSWSGDSSKGIAEIFRNWLRVYSTELDVFFTPDGIEAGMRWNDELSKTLEECEIGIFICTRQNVDSLWMAFEAGVLSKGINTGRVIPLIFGEPELKLKAPLSQFQVKHFSEKGVFETLESINNCLIDKKSKNEINNFINLTWENIYAKVDQELVKYQNLDISPATGNIDILNNLYSLIRISPVYSIDFANSIAELLEQNKSINRLQIVEQKKIEIQFAYRLRIKKLYELHKELNDTVDLVSGYQLKHKILEEEEVIKRLESDLNLLGSLLYDNSVDTTLDRENSKESHDFFDNVNETNQDNLMQKLSYSDNRQSFALKLDGNLEDLSPEILELILLEIHFLSKDSSIALHRIKEGSIILDLDGTEEGAKILQSLFESGQLKNIAGLPIKSIEFQGMLKNKLGHSYQYDVFISYSSQDRNWVKTNLITRLEDKGFKTCIDYRDFIPGMPSIKNIEQSVLNSHKTLLVMTPNYLSSSWTEFENILLQTLDPSNQQLRLIPVLQQKCDLPLRLRTLTYLNLANPEDESIEWHRLVDAVKYQPTT
jgi:TIR domain